MAQPIGAAISRANDQIALFTRFYATVNISSTHLSRTRSPGF